MRPVREQIGGLGNLMFKQAYLIDQRVKGEIPDLYVQREPEAADVVRAHFSDGIGPQIDKVALHIRRGDYLKAHNFHTDLWGTTDYYTRAVSLFPEDKFIVFCKDNQGWEQDRADREWCRQNLGPLLGDRFELPDRYNSETDDLNLMASCKSLIGANSSFSWWGAYLNPNPHRIIVMPREDSWFCDGVTRVELLPEWVKI